MRLSAVMGRLASNRLSSRAVIAVSTVAIIALVVGLIAAANRFDSVARLHDEQLVANGLKVKDAALRSCVSPNTVWDDAVAHLDVRYDPEWAASNLGQYLSTTCDASDVYVIDGDGKVLGAWRNGEQAERRNLILIRPTVDQLINQIRLRESARGKIRLTAPSETMIARPIDETAMIQAGGNPVLVSASLVQPDFGTALPRGDSSPIVVAVQPVDRDFLAWIGKHYLLQDLKLSGPEDRDAIRDRATVTLTDSGGVTIGRLSWDYGRPASDLVTVVAPSLGLLLLILIGSPAITIYRERRHSKQLREAKDDAQSASEAKSRFIANMSHEIRTPMNGVIGILHLLSAKSLDDDTRHLVSEALASGMLLQRLLNDVLDISRIEEGRLELEFNAIDPVAAAEGVVGLFEAQARAKGIDLTLSTDHVPAWVMADDLRLRQVLLNLVGNAVKFTARGSISVRMTGLADVGKGRPGLRLEVVDSGIGIPAAAQAAMFRRFSQADASTARRFGGSGLGLSICASLVRLMGGEIGFVSEEGVGSTFWCTLPAEPVSGPETAETIAPAEPGAGPALQVLLVEDNPTNRLVAGRLLESFGVEVTMAENGLVGLNLAREGRFDLILMDIQMPEMDGVTATRQIRALPGQEGAVPIIGLTANVLPQQAAEYRAAGMNDVAAKPIQPARLIEQINAVLFAAQDDDTPQAQTA